MKPNKIAKMLLIAMILMTITGMQLITAKAYGAEVPTDDIIEVSEAEAVTETAIDESESKEVNKVKKNKKKNKSKKKNKNKVKAAPKASYTKEELKLMSAIIWCEAQGESKAGKLAVGIVVMNRKASSSFPNSVRGVIYQKGQFSPTRNGHMNKALKLYKSGKFKKSKAGRECIAAAKKALEGRKEIQYKGKKKSLKGYYFFSQYLSGCRLKLGGHMFK